MLAQQLNELTFTLEVAPLGPLLVKAGETATVAEAEGVVAAEVTRALGKPPMQQIQYFRERRRREQNQRALDKERRRERQAQTRRADQAARHLGEPVGLAAAEEVDMRFVRTQRNGRWEPYLPGATLKGVLRSAAERLARSLTLDGQGACTLFGEVDASTDAPCWRELGKADNVTRLPPPAREVYGQLCLACKLFGSPFLAGRLAISDAYLAQAGGGGALPRRDGVGIDRVRGAAAEGAKYDFEYWDGGAFVAQVRLQNFELWQVGWLAHLLYEWQNGRIAVGFGRGRGLGRVRGQVRELRVSYGGAAALAPATAALPLQGIGQLLGAERAQGYGLLLEPAVVIETGVRVLPTGATPWRRTWAIAEPEALWAVVGAGWNGATVAQLTAARQAAAVAYGTKVRDRATG